MSADSRMVHNMAVMPPYPLYRTMSMARTSHVAVLCPLAGLVIFADTFVDSEPGRR
jgi:hypothetical protein